MVRISVWTAVVFGCVGTRNKVGAGSGLFVTMLLSWTEHPLANGLTGAQRHSLREIERLVPHGVEHALDIVDEVHREGYEREAVTALAGATWKTYVSPRLPTWAVPCRFHERDVCLRGDNCNFWHTGAFRERSRTPSSRRPSLAGFEPKGKNTSLHSNKN